MKFVAIVPARGGSKGIPRKNIVPVGGKPLITWTLEQAMASRYLDGQVWVSTDDVDISLVASETTPLIVGRSPETATDNATTESAVVDWLDSARYAKDADGIVLLQATSPIRQADDIDNAVQKFIDTNADSLFSAREVEGYTWRRSSDLLSPQYSHRVRRQDSSVSTLEENGSIYVFRPRVLADYGSRLGGKIAAYVMHPLDSFQIDEPKDIPLIESLMEVRLGHHIAAAH